MQGSCQYSRRLWHQPHLLLRLYFFMVGSAFVGTNTSVGGTRQSKIPCLGSRSRLFFERVWVTQKLPCIPPGVTLDKPPSTSGRKFRIGRLTSSPIHPYQVWYWRGPRRVQPHSVFLRKTQALAQIEQRKRDLDSWDALVEKGIDSL